MVYRKAKKSTECNELNIRRSSLLEVRCLIYNPGSEDRFWSISAVCMRGHLDAALLRDCVISRNFEKTVDLQTLTCHIDHHEYLSF